MSIFSNASYKILTREEFKAFRKLNGNSQWNYDFGYKIVVQFYGRDYGYNSATDVLVALVKDFKNKKISEFSKNLKWAKGQLKFGTISKESFQKLDELTKSINKFLVDRETGKYAIKKMYANIEKTNKRCYNLKEMISDEMHLQNKGNEYSEYKLLIDSLYSKVKEIYAFRDQVNVLIESSQSFLKNHSSILKKVENLDSALIDLANQNLKKITKWTKNPIFLFQDRQKEDIENFKDTLLYFKKLIEEQKQTELQKEKEINFKNTGYFETNNEKAIREKNEKEKYLEFKKDLNWCKSKLRKEFKSIFPEKFKIWSQELEELEELVPSTVNTNESTFKLKSLSEDLTEAGEILDKPNREIKDFIKNSTNRVLIIDGMAGTGKTSKIAEIISICGELAYDKEHVLICAPSTVGAANIRQRWRLKTDTFQRLINNKTLNQFEYLKIFIVDEANMLTTNQLKMLFKKYKANNELKFIFIGDSGQINAYDHNNDESEESPALKTQDIIRIAKSSNLDLSKNSIRHITLNVDYRFLNIVGADKFLIGMKWLREDEVQSPIFENFLDKTGYPNSEVISTIKNKNEIIEKFNENHSIFEYLTKRIEIGQDVDIERLKKRFSLNYDLGEIKLAVDEYKYPENRRPELGKQYSKLFPNIKQRTKKPEEVDSSIILRRKGEGVVDSNLSIRPHLFSQNHSELKEIEVGELIFIKKTPKDLKENLLRTNIDDGDLVIVSKIYESIEHNGNKITHLGVKPVLKRLDTFSQNLIDKVDRFAKYFNFGISILSEIDIAAWHGNLRKEDDHAEWKKYIDSPIQLKPKDKKFHNPCLIIYGYARTMFTAQGGEWENVFVHQGDLWGYSVKEQSKYIYTAVSRTSKKVYFTN